MPGFTSCHLSAVRLHVALIKLRPTRTFTIYNARNGIFDNALYNLCLSNIAIAGTDGLYAP